jgi:hypothetical protein
MPGDARSDAIDRALVSQLQSSTRWLVGVMTRWMRSSPISQRRLKPRECELFRLFLNSCA